MYICVRNISIYIYTYMCCRYERVYMNVYVKNDHQVVFFEYV